MELLGKESFTIQFLAQLDGYIPFHEEMKDYIPMTKEEREINAEKVKVLADRLYKKYTGNNFPVHIKVELKKRTHSNIRSAGLCNCERDENRNYTVLEMKVEEELCFHLKDLIRVIKHELGHIYQIEQTGKTRHGKKFQKLLKEKFKLNSGTKRTGITSLQKREAYRNNKRILARLKALQSIHKEMEEAEEESI